MMLRVERTLHQDTNLCYGATLQNNFSQMGNENVLESDNIPSIFELHWLAVWSGRCPICTAC